MTKYIVEYDSFEAYEQSMDAVIAAAVERERARIIAGIDDMSDQCRALRNSARLGGDEVGARCMTNRLQELALVYGLVGRK